MVTANVSTATIVSAYPTELRQPAEPDRETKKAISGSRRSLLILLRCFETPEAEADLLVDRVCRDFSASTTLPFELEGHRKLQRIVLKAGLDQDG